MVVIRSRASYDWLKGRLLEDLNGVKNVRNSRYAKKKLRVYRQDVKRLHAVTKQVNETVMYLDQVVINI